MKTPLILSLIFLTTAGVAQAGQTCGDRTRIVDQLSSRFGEERISIGLGADHSLIEVFGSSRTGTWTILRTLPDGPTCMVANGTSFETIAAMPQGQQI